MRVIDRRKRALRCGALIAALLLAACAQLEGIAGRDEPESGLGDYMAGRFAASQRELGDAARYYRRALERDPANPVILEQAFFATASAGDVGSAARLAERIVATEPDDRAARLTLAVDAFRRRDYKAAGDHISKSAEGPFTTIVAGLVGAWALAGQGDFDGALARLKPLDYQPGTAAFVAYHRALINDLAGRDKEAEADYRNTIETAGPGLRVVEAYGRFLERHGRGREAASLYERVANGEQGHPIAAAALARIRDGRKPDPLVAAAEHGAAEALFGVAASLNQERSVDIALLYLNLALHMRPDLDFAIVLMADHYEKLQKYDAAIAAYERISRRSPYYDLAQIQMAIDEGRVGRTDAAVARLRALSRRRPDDAEMWTALGDVLRGAERYEEAREAYDEAIRAAGDIDEREWTLLFARAIALERTKRWDEAERDLKHALSLSPDQPQVLNYLGYSWVEQGVNLDEALEMLEKARSLRPFDGYIVDSVGWAYYRLGRYEDAVKLLEEAAALQPGDPTINDHLGDAYWMVGRKIEARFQWRHALAYGPEPEDVPRIQRKLESGLGRSANAGL